MVELASVFSLGEVDPRNERERSGVGRASGGIALSPAVAVAPEVALHFSCFKASLSPRSSEGSAKGRGLRVGRSVSPLVGVLDDCVLHQLLSGQVRPNSDRGAPPNMSCLLDCGDRGLRPF